MKQYFLKLNKWWENLARREKKIISIGSFFTFFMIFFAFIWWPELDSVRNLRKKITQDQHLLAWMKAADDELSQMPSEIESKLTTPVELLSILHNKINRYGLQGSLIQLKQISNDAIEMNFRELDFDKLMLLLAEVCQQQAVTVEQFSAVAGKVSGQVKAQLILKLEA